MSRRIQVHHFVANLTTKQYGTHPTSDVLGVDYWYDVPADTEFPRTIPRIDLFTRFYMWRARPVEYFVRVWWLDSPRRLKGEMLGQFGPFPVMFHVADLVRDHVFRVANLQLRGTGLHAVRLVRPRRTGWQKTRWGIVAETHFRVER